MENKHLLINLRVLGLLEKGVKLNTRDKFFTIDPVSLIQGLKRFYRKDDRTFSYEKISTLVSELQQYINKCSPDQYEIIGPIILKAQKGLETLKETYEDDKTFVSQMEFEISNFNVILKKIGYEEEVIVEHFHED